VVVCILAICMCLARELSRLLYQLQMKMTKAVLCLIQISDTSRGIPGSDDTQGGPGIVNVDFWKPARTTIGARRCILIGQIAINPRVDYRTSIWRPGFRHGD
jgi:hypothetical protein